MREVQVSCTSRRRASGRVEMNPGETGSARGTSGVASTTGCLRVHSGQNTVSYPPVGDDSDHRDISELLHETTTASLE